MNGLLLFMSSSIRYKRLSLLSMIIWLFFMLLNADFSLGYIFPLINFLIFIIISSLPRLNKGLLSNKVYSVFSILLWSITVDIVCYFIFPSMVFNQSIFLYIFNGILFNSKFVVYNTFYLVLLETFSFIKKDSQLKVTNLFINRPIFLTANYYKTYIK